MKKKSEFKSNTIDNEFNFEAKHNFSMPEVSNVKTNRGLDAKTVRDISKYKKEPKWMTDFRLNSYAIFKKYKLPTWGVDLSPVNFEDITYFLRATKKQAHSWDDLPDEI